MEQKIFKITKIPHRAFILTLNLQLKDTESAVKYKLQKLLTEVRGFKIESGDKTKYDTFYSHSKAETSINENDIDNVFKTIYTTTISNIQKCLRKGSG